MSAPQAGQITDEWGPLDTVFVEIDPRKLRRQSLNARFMTAAQMDQLVANIRRDGRLTSTPLCYRPPGADDEAIEIISGHHRVQGSIKAELKTIRVEIIVSALSPSRKAAIQLSHNAIVGQDDPTKLAALYADLDLDSRRYSGLTDDVLNAFKDLSLAGLSVAIKYQEINLFFLPEEADVVREAWGRIEKAAKKGAAYVASYRDWDAFFRITLRVKAKFDAFNSAVAMRYMIDLAMQRLAQIEADEEEAAGKEDAKPPAPEPPPG